jgi:hypothetical protein
MHLQLKSYPQTSRTISYGLISIMPLLLIYEGIIAFLDRLSLLHTRNTAEIFLKHVVQTLGVDGRFFLLVVLGAIAMALFLRDKKKTVFDFRYFFLIFIEALFYATFLGMIFGRLTEYVLLSTANSSNQLWEGIALAIGAGVYEELLFRALIFHLTAYTLVRFLHTGTVPGYLISALFSALAFSWFHYIGGQPFELYSAVYRFFVGLFLCLLYLLRGLGVTAWTHSLYNCLIVIQRILF